MIEGATSETKGHQVLIWHHNTYAKSFIPGEDREEAEMAGHLVASESLGLGPGEYHLTVTPATRYQMEPAPKRKRRKR